MTGANPEASLGPDAAPAPSPQAAAVELDGEAVVYHEGTGGLHLLNRTAAMIWASLDGRTTLGELAAWLAEASGAEPDRVRADVVDAVREFARLGLLDDGAPTRAGADPSGDDGDGSGGPDDADGDGPRTVPVAGST